VTRDLRRLHRIAEAQAVERLRALQPDQMSSRTIGQRALRLAERVRAAPPSPLSAESFLRSYASPRPKALR